jgi:DNA-binding protein HU-beta
MAVLDATFSAIEGALKKGQEVRLVGFGSWKKMRRKARPGRNPQTGKTITIPARNIVKFSMGQHLYDMLN